MTSGSKMPIAENWNKMRFFTSWTNLMEGDDNEGYHDGNRVDIDLTVAFCDKNMNVVEFCGWNGSKHGDGFVYSGDVQDGGPADGEGRAEFIDVDIDKLKERGIVYLVPQVNSYTNQKFSEQPHTCFGVMKRTDKDMGKKYEPATVVNRFVLDIEAKQASMYIIDISNREILWLNEKAQENVASRGLYGMLNQVGRVSSSKTMSLNRLIEANVMSNGEFTKNPQDADIIFVRADEMQEIKDKYNIPDADDRKFILSSNMEYITGYLMQEGTPASGEKTKEAPKETKKTISPEDIKVEIEIHSEEKR